MSRLLGGHELAQSLQAQELKDNSVLSALREYAESAPLGKASREVGHFVCRNARFCGSSPEFFCLYRVMRR